MAIAVLVDKTIRNARSLVDKGSVAEAEALLRAVQARIPHNMRIQDELKAIGGRAAKTGGHETVPPALANALTVMLQQGRVREALGQTKALSANYPGDPFAHHFTGLCHAAVGQHEEAVKSLTRARTLQQNAPGVLVALGDCQSALGQHEEAAESYRGALEQDAGNARVLNNLGAALVATGDKQGAADAFEQASQADPRFVDAAANLGLALLMLGETDRGAEACQRAIEIDPGFMMAHINLAKAHDTRERYDDAIRSLENALELNPGHLGAYDTLFDILDRRNRVDEMRSLLARAREHLSDDNPQIRYRTAQIAVRDNDHETARELLERFPDTGNDRMESRRLALLGEVCDRLGDHKAAFRIVGANNALLKETEEARARDPGTYLGSVAHIAASFAGLADRPWPAAPAEEPGTPVFLVGFPRSGTTLLDTILRSHPQITVIEEQPMTARMRTRLGGLPDRERLEALDDDDIRALRKAYRDELRLHLPEEKQDGLVIDKLPLNIINAGLIDRVFPDAKFILALRHPCDCVLSCYMRNFRLNEAMACFLDLETSAQLYDDVMRLWTTCEAALDLRAHTVRYEDLITDFDTVTRDLLGFLDVEWDERVRGYRETAKARGRINTPSYNQVTEKLYSHASGRWENYRDEMAPALPLLEPWASKWGYT